MIHSYYKGQDERQKGMIELMVIDTSLRNCYESSRFISQLDYPEVVIMTFLPVMTIHLAVNSDITHIVYCCYVKLQERNVFSPHSWNICWIDYSFLRSIKSLHMECVCATL